MLSLTKDCQILLAILRKHFVNKEFSDLEARRLFSQVMTLEEPRQVTYMLSMSLLSENHDLCF